MNAAIAALAGVGLTSVAQGGIAYASHRWQLVRDGQEYERKKRSERTADKRGLYARYLRASEDFRLALHEVWEGAGNKERESIAMDDWEKAANELHHLYHEVCLVCEEPATLSAASTVHEQLYRGLEALYAFGVGNPGAVFRIQKHLTLIYDAHGMFLSRAREELGLTSIDLAGSFFVDPRPRKPE
ncbi:hypothetical protein NE236_00145 [Actinoallomurus purpureus]|uniref:hypothetical protein n=1 Tax=Actinoallomurus purpureus TaxID=478114 RepID=UPI0020930478|nr:hypothetical protein [Actinoallomurus purpureus]MCO6003387.1 hypothetical protein [Actinoallomurus purpureus]